MSQAKVLEQDQDVNKEHIVENQDIKVLQENTRYSVADELLKLSDLHKQGILTDDEYETQKNKVLNRN